MKEEVLGYSKCLSCSKEFESLHKIVETDSGGKLVSNYSGQTSTCPFCNSSSTKRISCSYESN